jgi:hypothetical protein
MLRDPEASYSTSRDLEIRYYVLCDTVTNYSTSCNF